MSTETQNGSHLTLVQTPAERLEEIANVERLILAEKARLHETQEMLLRKANEMSTRLVDPEEDDEPQPETDVAPINKRKVAAVVWLSVLGISLAGAVGYRISQEGIPDVPQIFTTTQVGSVCDNCEG
jgi:hypothetical protein